MLPRTVPRHGVSATSMFAVITVTGVVIFITIIISLLPHSHPQTSAYGESFAGLLISSANSHLQASVIKLCPPPGVLPLPSAPAKTQPILLDSAQIPAWASPRPTHTPPPTPRPSQNPQPSDFPDHMTYFPNPALTSFSPSSSYLGISLPW